MIPPNRPNLIAGSAAVCLAFLASSCITRTFEDPPDLGPRAVQVLQRYSAVLDGRSVGRVTLLRVEDAHNPQALYKVEHTDGQHAGWIDPQGRAWREEPFHDGMILVAMDSMGENLRRLLELGSMPRLRALPSAE